MKHLEKVSKALLTGVILLITSGMNTIWAQDDSMDSVEVSLLTCSPHEEVYSLYGHSAIRWHNLRTGEDVAFNWGMFSFQKPYFVLRFVAGLTDYELGAYPFERFWPYYQKWGSSITEQVLNLTPAEKQKIQTALADNLKPENRVYRYNFFYDNCSTRPRDIIEKCLDGQILYQEREDYQPTFREIVAECNRNHAWSNWGIDMLLGVKADFRTNREEQEFLPMNLMQDFARAQIYENGTYRPLVKEQRTVVPPGVQIIANDFPFSPTEVAVIFLLISLCIAIGEWKRKKTLKYWDITLMTIQGLIGCLLTVMLFSQHPTTSTNLLIFLFNPLPLFFIPSVFRRKDKRWWIILGVMLGLFAFGGLFQHYPEGMWIVALCLLIRIIVHGKK